MKETCPIESQTNKSYQKIYKLVYSRNFKIECKLQIYKTVIKSSWTYEIKIWRTAAKSNVKEIESSQFIVLRTTLNARSNFRNDDIRKIVKISTVGGEMVKHSEANHYGIKIHTSKLVKNCRSGFSRKFKRKLLSANLLTPNISYSTLSPQHII